MGGECQRLEGRNTAIQTIYSFEIFRFVFFKSRAELSEHPRAALMEGERPHLCQRRFHSLISRQQRCHLQLALRSVLGFTAESAATNNYCHQTALNCGGTVVCVGIETKATRPHWGRFAQKSPPPQKVQQQQQKISFRR